MGYLVHVRCVVCGVVWDRTEPPHRCPPLALGDDVGVLIERVNAITRALNNMQAPNEGVTYD